MIFSLQVASIYRDASISNFINIVVVKIAVFRSEQVSEVVIRPHSGVESRPPDKQSILQG